MEDKFIIEDQSLHVLYKIKTKKTKMFKKAGVDFLKNFRGRVLVIGLVEYLAKYYKTYENRQRVKSSITLRKPSSEYLLGQYTVHVNS